jgi:hypothetical protein
MSEYLLRIGADPVRLQLILSNENSLKKIHRYEEELMNIESDYSARKALGEDYYNDAPGWDKLEAELIAAGFIT